MNDIPELVKDVWIPVGELEQRHHEQFDTSLPDLVLLEVDATESLGAHTLAWLSMTSLNL